jgi:outer membrane protein, heavy metal efflux system
MKLSRIDAVIWSSPLFLIAACAPVRRDAGFHEVRDAAAARAGVSTQWNRLQGNGQDVRETVAKLLQQPLTADQAVRLAMINNPELQATFEDLGIAQAQVVAASLLKNPVLDGEVKFSGEGTLIELALVGDLLDLFLLPLRTRVAEAEYHATRLRVTEEVIWLAAEARQAFIEYQAAEQTLQMRRSVVAAFDASTDLARRLHEAGNITELDLAQERAIHEQAKIDLASAETAAADARERVNVVLGLWGGQTQWTAEDRLPEPGDADDALLHDIERRAVSSSLQFGSRAEPDRGRGTHAGHSENIRAAPRRRGRCCLRTRARRRPGRRFRSHSRCSTKAARRAPRREASWSASGNCITPRRSRSVPRRVRQGVGCERPATGRIFIAK